MADNSLTAADINGSALANTLSYKGSDTPSDTAHLASVGPYVLTAYCAAVVGNGVAFYLTADGPAGHSTASYLEGDGVHEPIPQLRSSATTSASLLVGNEADSNSPVDRNGGTITLESGSTVVTIVFDSVATYNGGSGHCSIHGTATLGS